MFSVKNNFLFVPRFESLSLGLLAHSRDNSVAIAAGYGLEGPGIESRWRARFSASVQTCPGSHPASYTMGTGSFPAVNQLGRGTNHTPLSSAEVKEKVELIIYTFMACYTVRFTF